jgi:hypothetical protein
MEERVERHKSQGSAPFAKENRGGGLRKGLKKRLTKLSSRRKLRKSLTPVVGKQSNGKYQWKDASLLAAYFRA